MKWYIENESGMYLSEKEVRDEFEMLVDSGDIEYNSNQFDDYLQNCLDKDGQLTEVYNHETLETLNRRFPGGFHKIKK